jgi:glucose-1-phosphate thymidylyltransferase
MKGIILAGGTGKRLDPLTRIFNKHCLPVYNKPMIYYPLKTLLDSSINQIAIVCGPPFGDQVKQTISCLDLTKEVSIEYIEQLNPLGMADAILRCEKFAQGDNVIVSAGDNVYENNFLENVMNFKFGAESFLRLVGDVSHFAIPVYNDSFELIDIQEKPITSQKGWAITGPHLFDSSVYQRILSLSPSKRGELEITDLNKEYLKSNELSLVKRNDYWADVGTFDTLLTSSLFFRDKMKL